MSTLNVNGTLASPTNTTLNISTSTNQTLGTTYSGTYEYESRHWYLSTSNSAPTDSSFTSGTTLSASTATLTNTSGGNLSTTHTSARFNGGSTADTYYVWVRLTLETQDQSGKGGPPSQTTKRYGKWSITTSDPTTTPIVSSVSSNDSATTASTNSSLRSASVTTTVTLSSSGSGGTLQYGRNTSNSTPSSWQSSNTFTGTRGTTHYYFARRSSSTVSGGVGHTPSYIDPSGRYYYHYFVIQNNFAISYGATTFSHSGILPTITSSTTWGNLQGQCEYRILGPTSTTGGRTVNSYDSGYFNFATSGSNYQLTGSAIPISDNTTNFHFLRVYVRRPVNVGGDGIGYGIDQSSGSGSDSTFKLTVAANAAPTANAGPDRSIVSGGSATLSGSANESVSYSWARSGHTSGSLANATSATATWTAPNTNSTQTFNFVLTVTDSGGLTATDTMTVTVGQLISSFTASSTVINEGQSITLTSTSVGASSLLWQEAGGSGTFSSTTASTVTWTTPTITENSAYQIFLTVTGSSGSTAQSSTIISVFDTGNAGSGTARSAVTGIYGFQVWDKAGNLQIRGTGERVARLASTSASSVAAGSGSQTITNPVGSNDSNSILLWSPTTSYSGSSFARSCPVHSIGSTTSTVQKNANFSGNVWWMRFDGTGNSVPSHGMQITNSSGHTVVEQDYQGLAYKESGTSTSGNTYTYSLYMDEADVRHINFANSYSVAPFIALKGGTVCSPLLYWNGSAYTGMQIRCPKGASVTWAVVVPRQSGQTPAYSSDTNTYGIKTYAADGSVNWDSNWQQVAVVDVLDVKFGFNLPPPNWTQSSIPSGASPTLTFSQTPTKASGYAWGTYRTWYKKFGVKYVITDWSSYSGATISISATLANTANTTTPYQVGYSIRGTNPSGQAVEVHSLENGFRLAGSGYSGGLTTTNPRKDGETLLGSSVNVVSLQNDTDFDGVYAPEHPNVDDISKGQPDGSGPSSTGAPQLITHAACPNAWYIFNAAFGNVRYRAQAFPYIYEGAPGAGNPTGNFIEGGGDHLLGMTQKDSTHTSVAMTRLGGYRSWDGNNINGTDYSRTKSGTSITPGGRILVCNINV